MRTYLLRRIVLLIPTLFIVTVTVFLMVRLMPGSLIDVMLSEMGAENMGAGVDREALEHRLGLDVPIYEQYFRWIGDIILHGDLGTSLRTGRPLTQDLAQRIPVTFELGLLSIIIINIVGIPIGVYSAIRQNAWFDYVARVSAIIFMAAPAFWMAKMLIVYGGRWVGYVPDVEYIPFVVNPIGNLRQFIIPAILTGATAWGGMIRTMRTITLEVIRQDYVRTAWAKGLSERVVVIRHAMRNAMIPLLTMFIPQIGVLIGGSVIMEQIFALPGMGRYLLDMLMKRDYLIVSGTNLIYAVIGMGLIILTDISYAWADPRIRYG
ncbi:MAG TPA: ABC transporter permease [Dehalococcoidales bacterium]|nr:ABC transporter permease [Dehalococcoidales bacterium]